jgi:glycosyltransferase involved in cell wall biosynthesis
MKIAQVAHGQLPIPAPAWGAIEGIVWNLKVLLETDGHRVDVFNTPKIHEALLALNRGAYDFVHCHNELFALHLRAHLDVPYAMTSQHGGLSRFVPADVGSEIRDGYEYLFRDCMTAPAIIAPSPETVALFTSAGYTGFLRLLPNGAHVGRFRSRAEGNGRAICLGRICKRKRQAWLSQAAAGRVPVDFVGPWSRGQVTDFVESSTTRYLGEWDRETVYERLSEYSCLVLASESEAAPLVVPEALAAGLSVVITNACTANLDAQPFIAVLNDGDSGDIAVQRIVEMVDINAGRRADIVEYARSRFDYRLIADAYTRIVEDFVSSRA